MKKLVFFVALVSLLLLFGCIQQQSNQGSANETTLDTTQGIDILKNKLFISELTPNSIGSISFTVRDNLGGVKAKDIIVGLDNLGSFKILECGVENYSYVLRSNYQKCNGEYGYDKYLDFGQHGVPIMLPGQEINFGWRIRAPGSRQLGYITLSQPLFYYLEYTYFTATSQSVVFMSQSELERREQTNSNIDLTGQSKLSAGEITVNLHTQQPIIYYYTYPNSLSDVEPPYLFTLVFKVKNVGDGFPMSDILIITHLPDGINVTSSTFQQGWYPLNSNNCFVSHVTYFSDNKIYQGGNMKCSNWIKYVFGKDVYSNLNDGHTYVYVIGYTELPSDGQLIPMDLKITSSELTNMKRSGTPMKFFTFQSYVVYRYYKEGETNINVYPLRV